MIPSSLRPSEVSTREVIEERRGLEFGLGTPDDPIFPNMHTASAAVCGASIVAAQAVASGDCAESLQPRRRAPPCSPQRGIRLLHLQRPRGGDRGGARRAAGSAHHVRRCRRPSRRRGAVDLLRGPTRPYRFVPRVRALPLSRDRFRGRDRERRRDGNVREHPVASLYRERRLPLGSRADRAGSRCCFPSTSGGDSTRSRHAPWRSAGRCRPHDGGLPRDGARSSGRAIEDHASGRWVATGGGGYQPTTVVPKVWTIHFAEMVGRPEAIPDEWLDDVEPERVSRSNRSEVEGSVKTVLDACVPRLEVARFRLTSGPWTLLKRSIASSATPSREGSFFWRCWLPTR